MTELSLAEQIAARLRRDILRGKLPPDTAIKERDNAAELGVSRSPIVARHTVKEVHDQVVVLLTLEKLSAHLVCVAASDSELDGLTQLNGRIGEAYDHVDALDLFEMDMAFHRMIAEISRKGP